MVPVDRDRSSDLGDILVADSGESFWCETQAGVKIKIFRTGFAIYRDEGWIASTEDHLEEEFKNMTKRAAKDARIAEAIIYANKYLKQTSDAGLYDGSKTEFSQRPN